MLAAIVYGASIHFKIIPIIYAPTFLFCLDEAYTGRKHAHAHAHAHARTRRARLRIAVHKVLGCITRERVLCTAVSMATVLLLSGVCYHM